MDDYEWYAGRDTNGHVEKSVTFYANTCYSGRKKRAAQDKIYFGSNLFGPPPPSTNPKRAVGGA